MTITVQIKNVFGNETIYPVCPAARAFAAIAGTKTLTRHALILIKGLGYAITVKAPVFAI